MSEENQNEETTEFKKEDVQLQVLNQNNQIIDYEKSIAFAEKFMSMIDRMRKLAILMTNFKDWIDQSGTPYLQDTGCSKISKGFGVTVFNFEISKERETDDRGEYIIYTVKGSGQWHNNIEQEIGTGSTRDKFFGQRTREKDGKKEKFLLPLSEVDLPNVKKKAMTNFHNRLIKKLLGLSFTWDEVEKYSNGKITKVMCTAFTYDKGGQGGKQTSADSGDKRNKCRNMLKDLCGEDYDTAQDMLEEMTTWKNTDGKTIKGKRTVKELSENQLGKIVYPKLLTQWQVWDKNQKEEHKDFKNGL